mmetsp:Transcript_68275/g.189599  ORF Transcript_68275/g.189599 Transcript_68275/m.189599 type:complete len:279 (-) Transcript_68275:100-936(-)
MGVFCHQPHHCITYSLYKHPNRLPQRPIPRLNKLRALVHAHAAAALALRRLDLLLVLLEEVADCRVERAHAVAGRVELEVPHDVKRHDVRDLVRGSRPAGGLGLARRRGALLRRRLQGTVLGRLVVGLAGRLGGRRGRLRRDRRVGRTALFVVVRHRGLQLLKLPAGVRAHLGRLHHDPHAEVVTVLDGRNAELEPRLEHGHGRGREEELGGGRAHERADRGVVRRRGHIGDGELGRERGHIRRVGREERVQLEEALRNGGLGVARLGVVLLPDSVHV